MKKNLVYLLITLSITANAQFTKEKLHEILCGTEMKTWDVNGINVNRPEKTITFNSNNTAGVKDQSGKVKIVKWSLNSTDNIRWFLNIDSKQYEMIVSYDKKGEQYVKLKNTKEDYEMKLNQTQSK